MMELNYAPAAAAPACSYPDGTAAQIASCQNGQNGVSWTDYIYANGQKIARLPSTENVFTISGENTQSGQWAWFINQSLAGYVIQPGDKWMWRQRQHGVAHGGWSIDTNQGPGAMDDTTPGGLRDSDGQLASYDETGPEVWHQRVFDLSPMAGNTIQYMNFGNNMDLVDGGVGNDVGAWSIDYADAVIYSPSTGRTFPILTGPQNLSAPAWSPDQGTQLAAFMQTINSDLATAPRYYLADQVGTTQMEISSGGWPLFQGQFTPLARRSSEALPFPPSSASSPPTVPACRSSSPAKKEIVNQGWTTSGPGTTRA